MKLFAIFGNPVAHSRSPLIHNALFLKRGDPCRYVRFLVDDGKELRHLFSRYALDGVNITVPFKEDALTMCDEVVGIASEIGAVNTVVKRGEKLIGYNTDAPGFIASIAQFSPKKILILGAGGTARALCVAFSHAGISFAITNRSEERLTFFKEKGYDTFLWDDLSPSGYDMVINTTSAGLVDTFLPLPEPLLTPLLEQASVAVDCIYGKTTPFLALAQKVGCKTQDGALMLIHQAVLANEIFMDGVYQNEEALEIMKKIFFL